MTNGRAWVAATMVGSALLLASAEAEASGIEACFRDSQSFAMCNGFIASLAGLGGMASPIVALASPEEPSATGVGLGVGLGIYAGASGAALIASSQAQDPTSATRTSGTILGTVALASGGGALVLSGLAGIVMGIGSDDDDDEDDDEVARVWRIESLGVGVPGAAGPALGLTIGGSF